MRAYCVTGVPLDAQKVAALRGLARKEREQLEGKGSRSSTKHRVSGQVIRNFCGYAAKAVAEKYAEELRRRGFTVTLRRKNVGGR